MSNLQFKRNVRAIVGPRGGTGFDIDGLRVTFEVAKTSRRFPNKAKIQIYNLSQDNASTLERSRDLQIQLFAGYGDDPPLLFTGDIRKGRVTSRKEGVNRITTIEASSGYNAYTRSKISTSFKSGITVAQAIKQIEQSFDYRINVPDNVDTSAQFSSGLVLAGRTSDVFQTIADSIGVDWYFEDDTIKLVGKNSDTGDTAILLSEKTGLVGTSTKTNKGRNVKALLNAALRPRRLVQVQDSETQGFYRIQRASHKGDSWSGDFFSMIETVQVGGAG